MLTIEHLTKQFGEKTLFRDLCLTVEGPAVLWAPSGWGKTTLLPPGQRPVLCQKLVLPAP